MHAAHQTQLGRIDESLLSIEYCHIIHMRSHYSANYDRLMRTRND